jgi:hypothetical protein
MSNFGVCLVLFVYIRTIKIFGNARADTATVRRLFGIGLRVGAIRRLVHENFVAYIWAIAENLTMGIRTPSGSGGGIHLKFISKRDLLRAHGAPRWSDHPNKLIEYESTALMSNLGLNEVRAPQVAQQVAYQAPNEEFVIPENV